MNSSCRNLVAVCVALGLACCGAAAAQEGGAVGDAAQLQAEADRTVAEARRVVALQEGEVARAQAQLVQARRELESAAREIARIGMQSGDAYTFYRRGQPGTQTRATIGANIRDSDEGALVIGVTPGGPADVAGILSGDVIRTVGGTDVTNSTDSASETVLVTLAQIQPGAIVAIDALRAGEEMSFEVEADAVLDYAARRGPEINIARVFPGDIDLTSPGDAIRRVRRALDMSELFASRWHDMELVALSDDLGKYFEADRGLLVVRAPEAGGLELQDGDVILEISGREPASPEHALKILASFVPGESLEIELMRERRRRTIEYLVPDPNPNLGADLNQAE